MCANGKSVVRVGAGPPWHPQGSRTCTLVEGCPPLSTLQLGMVRGCAGGSGELTLSPGSTGGASPGGSRQVMGSLGGGYESLGVRGLKL